MKYNRANIQSTLKAALKSNKHCFVFATANGFTIWPSKPVRQTYYEVKEGKATLIPLPETERYQFGVRWSDKLEVAIACN